MKIRVEGPPFELDAAVDRLRQVFRVVSVSRPYKNRNSELCRVYVDAELVAQEAMDLSCLSCTHAEDCAEIGGRQEGRGYGAACVPGLTEPPHYERRQGAPDPELTPSPQDRDCAGRDKCCEECDYLMICFPADDPELIT